MRLKNWITNIQSCGEIESNRRFEVIRSGKGGQVNDKKIAIVPYVTNGRNSQVGHDGHFNIFKKKRSTVLKENLQSALASKNQEVEVVIDVNHGDLQFLKRGGVNLFLIPEDIASYMDYSGINMEECFQLTHDEYENGNVDRIVKYIEKN